MTSSKMQHEDGFHFYALPAPAGKVKSLIIILHGYGSHPEKFVKWGGKMQEENRHADVLVVRGPIGTKATPEQKAAHRMTGDDDLYAWRVAQPGKLGRIKNIAAMAFSRLAVVKTLNTFIDAQLVKRGLGYKSLALVGFSQGGLLAILAAVRRRRTCAAVVCHSGFVFPWFRAPRKPRTLLIMGLNDEFLVPSLIDKAGRKESSMTRLFSRAGVRIIIDHEHSLARLEKAGVPVTEKLFEGQEHRVTEESWQAASAFVAQYL